MKMQKGRWWQIKPDEIIVFKPNLNKNLSPIIEKKGEKNYKMHL